MVNNKYKLTKSIFSLALLACIPVDAYADDSLNVKCEYEGNLVCMINPMYWDYDYNRVCVSTNNTNIRLTKDEFVDLLCDSGDEVVIEDGGSAVIYDRNELMEQFLNAENIYNEDGEVIKKVVLNGGITLAIIISTGLCIYSEFKKKKLK